MDVDEYLRLNRLPATLLHRCDDGDLTIEVHEHAGERWVYSGQQSILSLMQLNAPADPVMPNHVAMLGAMLFSQLPRSVLCLGSGTGAFERFFADRLPATTTVSVDTSDTLVNLARRYFAMPQNYYVHIQPAEQFLQTNEQEFDLILCDIFQGDQHPACLNDMEFYANMSHSLADGGVMALNLSPVSEQALIDILLIMRRSFSQVILVNLSVYGNIIVYALQHTPISQALLHERADQLGRQLRLDLLPLPEQLTVLPEQERATTP